MSLATLADTSIDTGDTLVVVLVVLLIICALTWLIITFLRR